MATRVNQKYRESLSRRERFAIWVTNRIGTVECAIIFSGIGIGSIVGVITNNTLLALVCGSFSSYFLQLVLLPLIMVSQNLQQRHQEILAEKDYESDLRSEKLLSKMKDELIVIKERLYDIEQALLLDKDDKK